MSQGMISQTYSNFPHTPHSNSKIGMANISVQETNNSQAAMAEATEESSIMTQGSVFLNEKAAMIAQLKNQQFVAAKKESMKLMKQKMKQENRQMKEAQAKIRQIRADQERSKERQIKVMSDRWQRVQQVKQDQIRNEIIKIGEKDSEARKLEKLEQKILKKLRDTHAKQQEAIDEISAIFQQSSSNRLRIGDFPEI